MTVIAWSITVTKKTRTAAQTEDEYEGKNKCNGCSHKINDFTDSSKSR